MEDNLPLLPAAGRASECASVRPVLRGVQRALRPPPLPPLPAAGRQSAEEPRAAGRVQRCESELRRAHAAHTARHARRAPPAAPAPAACGDVALLRREHLKPQPNENATGDKSMWMRDALMDSCGDVDAANRAAHPAPPRRAARPPPHSECSMSIGSVVERAPPPELPPLPVVPAPQMVLCVPPTVDFINFKAGEHYTVALRLVNVSAVEVKLSVRPPRRRELNVQLCGRLTVTSGAYTEMVVHFRPLDVRPLRDEVRVRVSEGRALRVPVVCRIVLPVLEVRVPAAMGGGGGGAELLDLGARLLGEPHRVTLQLRCPERHALFFLLPEDTWITYKPAEVTKCGALLCGEFAVRPAAWRGGRGAVRAWAWCRARAPGLAAAALRVLAATAARPLTLIADTLHYHPRHVTLQAQEKTYDICSPDDPDCEHYVNLGTAFPGRALSATVELFNNSPLPYSYYWSARQWGVCTCWEQERDAGAWLGAEDDSERLCVGARRARRAELHRADAASSGQVMPLLDDDAEAVRVEPARSVVAPRQRVTQRVFVPDVGARLGPHRAVLMLVLARVPRESFPPGFIPSIFAEDLVEDKPVPGEEEGPRSVCDVVCCQLEVWWDVVPVRFTVQPAVVALTHSRRVDSVTLSARCVLLQGADPVHAHWTGRALVETPPPLLLSPTHPVSVPLRLRLAPPPNDYPVEDLIELTAEGEEFWAPMRVERRCATRHPALQPACNWLGLVLPGTPMHVRLELINDTYENICWWASPCRWMGENEPSAACRRVSCGLCHQRRCTCEMLVPKRGAFDHGQRVQIDYRVNAPETDGCVVTLVSARRTAPDQGQEPRLAGVDGRAALVAYRVLAPRLALRVLPCCAAGDCGCGGAAGAGGPLLRAARPLPLAGRVCWRLRITNVTPILARVVWDPPLDGEEYFKVIFTPNEFEIQGHTELEIGVALDGVAVSERRAAVRRATVSPNGKPLYLLVDAAVAGVELELRLPLGGAEQPESHLTFKLLQRATAPPPLTPEQVFAEEDARRERRRANMCHCRYWLEYIEPVKPPKKPPSHSSEYSTVSIVSSQPTPTRVCACAVCGGEVLIPDEPHHYSIQYWDMPLRKVCTRWLRLSNVGAVAAQWSAAPRRAGVAPARTTLEDAWAAAVRAPGLGLQVAPAAGALQPGRSRDVALRLYADSFGTYWDQILIQVQDVPPLVVDVWVRAQGAPLQFLLRPLPRAAPAFAAPAKPCAPLTPTAPPALWLSAGDSERTLRANNTTHCDLIVHAYLIREHEYPQDELPFRLYIRHFDMLPVQCPCDFDQDEQDDHMGSSRSSVAGESMTSSSHSVFQEMDTGFEVFLAADYGPQESEYFQVEPEFMELDAGASGEWRVTLRGAATAPPPHRLLLRTLPVNGDGAWWARCEPPPALALVRAAAAGAPRLLAMPRALRVELSAMALPHGAPLRVRKRIIVKNIGGGTMELAVAVASVTDVDVIREELVTQRTEEGEEGGMGEYTTQEESKEKGAEEREEDGGEEGSGERESVARWCVVVGGRDAPCPSQSCGRPGRRAAEMTLKLPPHSSVEVCVEVRVDGGAVAGEVERLRAAREARAADEDEGAGRAAPFASVGALRAPPGTRLVPPPRAAPRPPRAAPRPPRAPERSLRLRYADALLFKEQGMIVERVPLSLELECAVLLVRPALLQLGAVCEGDSRKTYFTVWHTSRTDTLNVRVSLSGGEEFSVWPRRLALAPGARLRVYARYGARWRHGAPAAAAVALTAQRAWCRAAAQLRAAPARDHKCALPPHDYTDSALP